MRRLLIGTVAGVLTVAGLTLSPGLALADHHGGDHHGWDHHGWDHHGWGHHGWDHHGYGGWHGYRHWDPWKVHAFSSRPARSSRRPCAAR